MTKIIEGLAFTTNLILGQDLSWEFSRHGLAGTWAEVLEESIETKRKVSRIGDVYDECFDREGFRKENLSLEQSALWDVLEAETACCGKDYERNLSAAIKSFRVVMGWA